MRILEGKCIWNTRPANAAAGLTTLFEDAGAIVAAYPVMFFESEIPESTALENLADTDWIIFTSQTAVHYGLPYCKNVLTTKVKIAAMGPATSAVLIRSGYDVTLTPAPPYESEGLIALLKQKSISGQKITIITGLAGREHLQAPLEACGAIVNMLRVYRRCGIETLPDFSTYPEIDMIIATSCDSVEFICEVAKRINLLNIHERVLSVNSQRVAECAKKKGFQHILIAESATDEALFTVYHQYCLGRNI